MKKELEFYLGLGGIYLIAVAIFIFYVSSHKDNSAINGITAWPHSGNFENGI